MQSLSVRVARVALAAGLACATGLPAAAHAAPPQPIQDSFYRYTPAQAKGAPGSILRTRNVDVTLGPAVPATATQVLYRTRTPLGAPQATAATVIRPTAQNGPIKVLSYQTAYDGLSDSCRPSYALRSGVSSNGTVALESNFIAAYLAQGYTVVTADYEGATDDYGAGRGSGYATLDAIRATLAATGAPAKTPVGMFGYSGGSLASTWAGEVQPRYAPDLNLVGIASGGLPVDFAHNLDYVNGSADWAGAIPALSIGLARGLGLDLAELASPRGRQVAAEVGKGCLQPAAYPGLKFEDLLKPRYKDWRKVPALVKAFNSTILGGQSPSTPILFGVGNQDGKGDGAILAGDMQQLAHTYCRDGVPVQFRTYPGLNHVEGVPPFEAEAIAYFQQRFAGAAPPNDCASIGAAAPLDALPLPAKASRPSDPLRLAVHRTRAHRYTLGVRATSWPADGVTIGLYRRGKKGRLAGVRRWRLGATGFDDRALRLPVRAGAKKRRYVLVADGSTGTAPIHQRQSLVLRAKKKRHR